ncbi:MAG: hypothetical protein KBE65_05110 [Phycisphaerae bacterium]|nr:hypothetical protein [Phycisphaerae bacterium]
MDNKRFSLEEFAALFAGRFESQEQLLREYQSFLAVFEQLDQAPVPELSDRQKAEIFRRTWEGHRHNWSWTWAWLGVLRRPAVTFAAGIALGCAGMFLALSSRPSPAEVQVDGPLAKSESPLTIEHIQRTQVYKGKAIERMYPGIENPQIVVEKSGESAKPQRVLYGTLDDGEIYVVWNL